MRIVTDQCDRYARVRVSGPAHPLHTETEIAPKHATGQPQKPWLTCLNSMAGVTGLEPATSGLTGQRSNQLSYTPKMGIRRSGQRTGFYRPHRWLSSQVSRRISDEARTVRGLALGLPPSAPSHTHATCADTAAWPAASGTMQCRGKETYAHHSRRPDRRQPAR